MMDLLLIRVPTIQDQECGLNGRNLAANVADLLVRRLPVSFDLSWSWEFGIVDHRAGTNTIQYIKA